MTSAAPDASFAAPATRLSHRARVTHRVLAPSSEDLGADTSGVQRWFGLGCPFAVVEPPFSFGSRFSDVGEASAIRSAVSDGFESAARPRTGQSSRPCTAPRGARSSAARTAMVGRSPRDGFAGRARPASRCAEDALADWRRRRENVSPPRAPSRVGTPPMTRTRMTRTRPRDSRFPPTDDGSSVVAHPVRGSGRNPVRSRTKAEARGRVHGARGRRTHRRASSSCPRVGRERERERRGWGSNPRRVGRRRAVVAVVALLADPWDAIELDARWRDAPLRRLLSRGDGANALSPTHAPEWILRAIPTGASSRPSDDVGVAPREPRE